MSSFILNSVLIYNVEGPGLSRCSLLLFRMGPHVAAEVEQILRIEMVKIRNREHCL